MKIIWRPGHCDITYNEIADETAKKASQELATSSILSDAVKQLEQQKSWKFVKDKPIGPRWVGWWG